MHVRDSGDGPVLLLLHAFGCDGGMWAPQAVAAVEAGWRVLVPDLPGFGESPPLDADPSLEAVAAALVNELRARDIERVVVCGVSLGGYLAMALLRSHPEMVAGIVLCDTKATADTQEVRVNRERLARMCLESPADTPRILEGAVLPGLLGESTRMSRPAVLARVLGWLEVAPAETVAWYQRAMAIRPDSLPVLADADLPTLVVWGDEDALSQRAEQDAMVAAVSDAALVVVSGAGHLANVEDPEAVTRAILSYLEVVRGPRHS